MEKNNKNQEIEIAMNPIDELIQGSFEDVLNKTIVPEYPCRRCKDGYSLSQFDYCDSCIEELIEEGE